MTESKTSKHHRERKREGEKNQKKEMISRYIRYNLGTMTILDEVLVLRFGIWIVCVCLMMMMVIVRLSLELEP